MLSADDVAEAVHRGGRHAAECPGASRRSPHVDRARRSTEHVYGIGEHWPVPNAMPYDSAVTRPCTISRRTPPESDRLRTARADGGSRDRACVPHRRTAGRGLPVRARPREPAGRRRRSPASTSIDDGTELMRLAAVHNWPAALREVPRPDARAARLRTERRSGERAPRDRSARTSSPIRARRLAGGRDGAGLSVLRRAAACRPATPCSARSRFYFASRQRHRRRDAASHAARRRPDGGHRGEGAAHRGPAASESGARRHRTQRSSGSTPTCSRPARQGRVPGEYLARAADAADRGDGLHFR